DLQTSFINEIVIKVPWDDINTEKEPYKGQYPIGEYLEIIDFDPASKSFYAPVNLNHPFLLAQDGLAPSVGNPQFHQQMVYAVAMTTIKHFENALGRVVLWAPQVTRNKQGNVTSETYVDKLRIYPHALREPNAYYSPAKKAILFGYFPSGDHLNAPGSLVFTCLSHDIITHEVTHAILDGMHPRFRESTNLDVLAFHEALSDIIAIFQHFAHPDVLKSQIALTKGNLEDQNLLGSLAQQFGKAIGRGEALRNALGYIDRNGVWQRRKPDPRKLATVTSPHERGAILVAAVFDAFLLIYKHRISDLLRISSEGTGILPEGQIHPDLVGRLTDEAARAAGHILKMVIRALDYCPPVDITFGDFLRGVITGDFDLYPEDEYKYRNAIIEAFRKWGIFPEGIKNLSIESLLWPRGDEALRDVCVSTAIQDSEASAEEHLAESPGKPNTAAIAAGNINNINIDLHIDQDGLKGVWNLYSDRKDAFHTMNKNAATLHSWLTDGEGKKYLRAFGLISEDQAIPPSVYKKDGIPSIEIHAVRTALRRGYQGDLVGDLVVEILQRRRGYFEEAEQARVDSGRLKVGPNQNGDFKFRRGCTIHLDPNTLEVTRVIRTRGKDITDNRQLEKVRAFLTAEHLMPNNAFDSSPQVTDDEDFAHLHRLH
ncbi:MAG: hypothetical protein KDC44_02445, partial [Phaeodactylibacter sp.]|nr:hypothetical protein [Phaeodactylibacter sp.]